MQRKARKLSESQTQTDAVVGQVTHPQIRGHVLIADGNDGTRERRCHQLREAGFQVSAARTAFEAIVKASCSLPDIILLDESLPGIEAAETGRLITTCPATAHIPVIPTSTREGLPRPVLRLIKRQASKR